jgi:hypothetical protein
MLTYQAAGTADVSQQTANPVKTLTAPFISNEEIIREEYIDHSSDDDDDDDFDDTLDTEAFDVFNDFINQQETIQVQMS